MTVVHHCSPLKKGTGPFRPFVFHGIVEGPQRSSPLFQRADSQRRGAYVVELAFVVIIFLMMLFGIIEYCRFTFIHQVIDNAAREGARYAVVNTSDTTVTNDTIAYVKQKMSGVDSMVTKYTCDVYKGDANGVKSGLAADAGFGEYIVVQIDCDYLPFLPSILYLNGTYHLTTKGMMYSEAN